VAEQYDALRPSYPDEMFDAIVAFGSLAAGERALEVGAGTGKATMSVLARGLRVDCIEPSAAMAAVLRGKGADVAETTFEAWPLRAGAYRLLYAAQAWHWVEGAGKYEKAAAALEPGGTIALFWNTPRELDDTLGAAIDEIYERIVPGSEERKPRHWGLDRTLDELASDFEAPQKRSFAWSQECTRAEFCDRQRTTSLHLALEPDQLERLLDEVGSAIDAHGGTVTNTYDAQLYLGMRR
jgi:SAM-dependent methyltransferase